MATRPVARCGSCYANSRDIKATANSVAGVNRDTVACPSVAVSPIESGRDSSDSGRLVNVTGPCRAGLVSSYPPIFISI